MLTFRPLTRSELPLLAHWLRQPHVARWWADDPSLEALEEDYGGAIDGTEPAEVFIAAQWDRPIGLIQRFRLGAYPDYVAQLAALVPVPQSASSIDYLIGDGAGIGQGLGTRLIGAFVAKLWADDPGTQAILVPVHLENVASWRVLEKNGFVRIAEGELTPDNPADSRAHAVYRLARTA